MSLVSLMAPELVLMVVACGLFLLGVSSKASSRRLAPAIALVTLLFVFAWQWIYAWQKLGAGNPAVVPTVATDDWLTFTVGSFAVYIKGLVAGVGVLLVLLAWPTNRGATGSASMDFGHEAGEFYALMLLSLSGVFLVSGANDIILLFLGVELASIPTYIMVAISRPLPVAQEAGVKYFFLGAMAAALMLFGFSYLYGVTGVTKLVGTVAEPGILEKFHDAATHGGGLGAWHVLGIVMVLAGFAFKIAAVPLHAYAGDVYQGAATPVTAFLAFVPKTSGFVAIIKTLYAVGAGPTWSLWNVPPVIVNLIIIVAGLTMTVGNVLGLLQFNVKRVLAYSSIAHSGYMLVGIAAMTHAPQLLAQGRATPEQVISIQSQSLSGVLFYLAAYGIMNIGAFGVLMLLPTREVTYAPEGETSGPIEVTPTGAREAHRAAARTARPMPATTAETFDDLAGQGRRHPALGLAMTVCCLSLIGLPLTIGFFGKFYLVLPALHSGLVWLVVVTMINAAISAAYYLRIVQAMYLRPLPEAEFGGVQAADVAGSAAARHAAEVAAERLPLPITAAVAVSVFGTLMLGIVLPATNGLTDRTRNAVQVGPGTPVPTVQQANATGR
jgi:NADH-quinone oxidoreductase subunit N